MDSEQQKIIIDKLKKLCKEYNVSISFGCGCCGAGIYYVEDGICKEFGDGLSMTEIN